MSEWTFIGSAHGSGIFHWSCRNLLNNYYGPSPESFFVTTNFYNLLYLSAKESQGFLRAIYFNFAALGGPFIANIYPPTETKGRHNSTKIRRSATALAVTAGKLSRHPTLRAISSALAHSTLVSSSSDSDVDLRKSHFFPVASSIVTFQSGFDMASIIAGKPPPLPTSNTFSGFNSIPVSCWAKLRKLSFIVLTRGRQS
eukprot:CAMPEP_0185281348 /NCGR_PEP_ID=MMETSP1359-20130426/66668_1 /TAXON_ID=552665 /ORGANISM="Bigelowiella longifila, Strain CCMP242" /LENGTH=198 /DNA_ID=CAMNT_0027876771 /DNA_START=883 /DNA_END=1480 /DNA_ORIENTATION=+